MHLAAGEDSQNQHVESALEEINFGHGACFLRHTRGRVFLRMSRGETRSADLLLDPGTNVLPSVLQAIDTNDDGILPKRAKFSRDLGAYGARTGGKDVRIIGGRK